MAPWTQVLVLQSDIWLDGALTCINRGHRQTDRMRHCSANRREVEAGPGLTLVRLWSEVNQENRAPCGASLLSRLWPSANRLGRASGGSIWKRANPFLASFPAFSSLNIPARRAYPSRFASFTQNGETKDLRGTRSISQSSRRKCDAKRRGPEGPLSGSREPGTSLPAAASVDIEGHGADFVFGQALVPVRHDAEAGLGHRLDDLFA